jgi:hypothetical protein
VDRSRADRVWASIFTVARVDGEPVSIRHACIACVRAVGAVGAGLSMTRGPDLHEPMFATEPISRELDELQFTLGEGPGVDAMRQDEVMLAADLTSAGSRRRWPMFAPAADERGVASMAAIPIRVGAARLGVLDLFWLEACSLGADQLADLLIYADAVLMLAVNQRGGVAPDPADPATGGLIEWRAEVHQASGMVSVQLGVDVAEALVRLRAYAYLHDRRLTDVAADVVARRLRFRPEDGTAGDSGADASVPEGPYHNGGSQAAPPPSTGIDKEGDA